MTAHDAGDAHLDPEQVLNNLQLPSCVRFADIGCGPGYFTIPAARRMQPKGTVYAIDLSQQMLAEVRARAEAGGLANVECVLAEDDAEIPLPSDSVEAALLCNVLHETDPTSMMLNEIRRLIKPGGELLLVEWLPDDNPSEGPPAKERIAPDDAAEELTTSGFVLEGTVTVGPKHYGLKFTRPGGDKVVEWSGLSAEP